MDDAVSGPGWSGTGRSPAASITLDPVASSAPEARRFVASCLGSVTDDDLRHTAALLVSELVTNAVLHAATPVTVTTVVDDDHVRVEVADGSQEVPTHKDYGGDAATGRGLTVLSTLASDWGTWVDDRGKVVWFELGDPVTGTSAPQVDSPAAPMRPGNLDDLVDMALLGVPVPILVRTQASYEELFREFRLILERDPATASTAIQGRLLDLVDEIGTRFSGFTAGAAEAWQAAVARRDDTVDLRYMLPRAVGPTCRRYDALLDEAHEFCRSAALLTLAPPADIVALRKWVLGEFSRQAAGGRAVAWADSTWAARFGARG